jgi:hypothetical protein
VLFYCISFHKGISSCFLSSSFLYTRKQIFGGGPAMQLRKCILGKEGGIEVLAGLAPSSQTIGSLLRTPFTGHKNRSKSACKKLKIKN